MQKNSKDTVAAMLRWWSLLEKFSCSASKLHLKPRRFKTFVEALGNQLLKDRNKTRKKCPRGDVCLSSSSPILNRTPGNESSSVKLLLVDVSNVSKVASSKGAVFKRGAEPNSNNKSGSTKGDLSATITVKQKRRAGGGVASAAYRKWERAAMAGVSLVADAAEELERNTVNVDARTLSPSSSIVCTVDGPGTNHMNEADQQAPAKLKLQLFPINETTRKALEKDLAGAEVADNPCMDDAKDTEVLCANSPPRSKSDSGLKDQSLADLYWADSLGPLDLEIPSVRYQAEDLLLGGSQNSWNRMMVNSLDAF